MFPRLVLLAGLIATGCGKHPGSYTTTAATDGASDVTAQLQKADALWEQRVDEAKLQEAIAAYELALETDPSNRHALARLTRSVYFWGDAFTDDKDVKVERWATAIAYGTRCIGLNSKISASIANGMKEKDAVAHATSDDVPCLYWTASAIGKWGKIQGIAKTLKHLPTVKAYISKVEELDPTFYNYGPARYWGAYYSALPSFAGQDLDKSAEYFEAAIQGAPYYLPTRVLRAEMWAIATQDVKTFDHDLQHVLQADPDAKPDAAVTPENTRDQDKARALLAKRSEFFEKKALEEAGPAPEINKAKPAPAPVAAPVAAPAPAGSTAERPDDAAPAPKGSSAERPDDTEAAPEDVSSGKRPAPTEDKAERPATDEKAEEASGDEK